ncbi:MAG: hypothetical protein INQ03_08360 [Candidatus Heimdallarchaeota archaeon]|nr:hypothetical protein [Candidatus Heimdallarchaeota archaeon]
MKAKYVLIFILSFHIVSGSSDVILFEGEFTFAGDERHSAIISFSNETFYNFKDNYQLLIVNDTTFPVGNFKLIITLNEMFDPLTFDEYKSNQSELACVFTDKYFASEKSANSASLDGAAKYNIFGFIESNQYSKQCNDVETLKIRLILIHYGESEDSINIKLQTSDIPYGPEPRPTDILTTERFLPIWFGNALIVLVVLLKRKYL